MLRPAQRRIGILLCPPRKNRVNEFTTLIRGELLAQRKGGRRISIEHGDCGLLQNRRPAFTLGKLGSPQHRQVRILGDLQA